MLIRFFWLFSWLVHFIHERSEKVTVISGTDTLRSTFHKHQGEKQQLHVDSFSPILRYIPKLVPYFPLFFFPFRWFFTLQHLLSTLHFQKHNFFWGDPSLLPIEPWSCKFLVSRHSWSTRGHFRYNPLTTCQWVWIWMMQ